MAVTEVYSVTQHVPEGQHVPVLTATRYIHPLSGYQVKRVSHNEMPDHAYVCACGHRQESSRFGNTAQLESVRVPCRSLLT